MKDVLGEAMHDYYFKNSPAKLWIHNTYGDSEDMPVKLYFRDKNRMPQLENLALQHCKGKVLDIGAGVGSHALALQQSGLLVTAMDISPKAVEVMKQRGVANAVTGDILSYNEDKFDTLLLMMNGIGVTGNIKGLRLFLQRAKNLIHENGQLIFDSSDVAYLYDYKLPQRENYYGEILYQYEYKNQQTDWFTWLYIDVRQLIKIAGEEGWNVLLLGEDKWDQYLVKLTLKS